MINELRPSLAARPERLLWLSAILLAVSFAGLQISTPAHELGHAIAALVLGGDIGSAQPFRFRGEVYTSVLSLGGAQLGLMAIGGPLANLAIGVVLILLLPWAKRSPYQVAGQAWFILFFLVDTARLTTTAWVHDRIGHDGLTLVRYTGANPLLFSAVAGITFVAALKLLLSHSHVLDSLRQIWSGAPEATDHALPVKKGLAMTAIPFAFVAWNVSGAIHELGHTAAVLLLGGTVVRVQLWPFDGPTGTWVKADPDGLAFGSSSGMLLTYALAFAAVTLFPWHKLTRRQALGWAIFLLVCFAQVAPLPWYPFSTCSNRDAAKFAFATGLSPVLVSTTRWILFFAAVVFVQKRTKCFSTMHALAHEDQPTPSSAT